MKQADAARAVTACASAGLAYVIHTAALAVQFQSSHTNNGIMFLMSRGAVLY